MKIPKYQKGDKAMTNTDNLKKFLEEGESVRWSGSPQPYGLFDEAHKTSTIVSLCWALLWGVILIGGYYGLSSSRGLEIKTPVMVICAAVPLLLAWSPVGDKNNIKKLLYVVTDKKVIVSPSEGTKELVLPITDINAMRIDKAGEDNCHIRFGSSTFRASAKKLLSLAIRGEFELKKDTKFYTGLVFYNINASDGEAICDYLKPYVTIEES
jgi:hypothetical protein